MNDAAGLRRSEKDQQRGRKSHDESQSHGSFWGKLSALLAIFGAAFSVTTFVVPVVSTMQKLALSVVVVSASSMMYRAIVALLNKKLDWVFAVLVLATLGVGSWYVVLLVEDRDSTITALKERIGTGVDVPPTEPPQLSPPGISTPQSPTPAESDLPDFDQSDAGVYSNGTVTLTVGSSREGLDIHSSSWMEHYGSSEYRDISFTGAGVSGLNGTQFALLTAGSDSSYATCQGKTSWVPVLSWNQIKRGSFACVKAKSGRRGILRIDQMPNLDSREPTVQITGYLWEPVVDR